jgi:hypothetical protein
MTRSLPFYGLLLITACHSPAHYPAGGYPYPENLSGKDTSLYYYPIKDKESRRDSMWDALTNADWRAIGEPNLSLRPMSTDVFRFLYSEALNQTLYIVTMTPTQLSVRICRPNDTYGNLPDTSLLDTLERRLIRVLYKNYPLDEKDPRMLPLKRHYIDSMGRLYPQLYDPAYYIKLRNKEYPHSKPWYTFTIKTIPLKPADFKHLITVINESGYWHLPFKFPCEDPPMDGWGYQLEANTVYQYNFVGAGSCDPDTSAFTKACQELVHYAGLDDKIQLVTKIDPQTHREPVVVEDVQLEDVKEPNQPKRKKIKTPHPN